MMAYIVYLFMQKGAMAATDLNTFNFIFLTHYARWRAEAIQEAAIRGVGKASELIDLNTHTGAHPRMGAADVVPFIPIEGVTIEDCVSMANHVGEEISEDAIRSRCTSTKRPQEFLNAKVWRTSGVGNLRAFGRKSLRIPQRARILATPGFIPRRARPSSARANS